MSKPKILLSTSSQIKVACVKDIFSEDIYDVVCNSISGGTEQPFADTVYQCPNTINVKLPDGINISDPIVRDSLKCCWIRHEKLLKLENIKDYTLAISIESGICIDNRISMDNETYFDTVDVIITKILPTQFEHYSTLNMPFDNMLKVPVPFNEVMRLKEIYQKNDTIDGETTGEHIAKEYQLFEKDGKIYDSKNWMKHFGMDRHIQIKKSLDFVKSIMFDFLQYDIKSKVITTPDFPESGITFQDYQYVFGNPEMTKRISQFFVRDLQKGEMKDMYSNYEITSLSIYVVVGPELRGYFGTHIANALDCPHIMVRKGKDGKRLKMGGHIEIEYITEKEYSEGDEVKEFFYCRPELLKDRQVIIFDDVLATGGSIDAVCRLVKKCGGHVIKLCFMADVPELTETAMKKLSKYPVNIDVVFDSK